MYGLNLRLIEGKIGLRLVGGVLEGPIVLGVQRSHLSVADFLVVLKLPNDGARVLVVLLVVVLDGTSTGLSLLLLLVRIGLTAAPRAVPSATAMMDGTLGGFSL